MLEIVMKSSEMYVLKESNLFRNEAKVIGINNKNEYLKESLLFTFLKLNEK